MRLLSDPGLSTVARNVAITTRHGVVTVRGDISNVRERSQIQAHANALRGVTRVDNLLHVARVRDRGGVRADLLLFSDPGCSC